MSINATCTFHGVGQGLFYSAIINAKKGKKQYTFSFVYDCGASKKQTRLTQSIEDFVDVLPMHSDTKPKLDLLIISHFHQDHISGLPKLLKLVDVDMVILPYTAPEMLLLYAIDAEPLDPFLRTFYSDPVTAIAGYGVNRIIQCVNNEDGYKESRQQSDDYNESRYNQNLDNVKLEFERIIDQYPINKTQVQVVQKLQKASVIQADWQFLFWNDSKPSQNLTEYVDEINKYRLKNNFLDVAHLIANPSFIRTLKKTCINNNILNQMSIIVHHRPVNAKASTLFFNGPNLCNNSKCDCPIMPRFYHQRKYNCATLLTGDIELDRLNDKSDSSSTATEILNEHTDVLLVPHHGSGMKWDAIDYRLKESPVFVLSYGITNQYGHPDATTISNILKNRSNLITVNEGIPYIYHISVL